MGTPPPKKKKRRQVLHGIAKIPPFWAPPPQKKKKRRQVLGSLKFRPSGLPPPKKKKTTSGSGIAKIPPFWAPPPRNQKKKTTSGSSGIAKIPPFWAPPPKKKTTTSGSGIAQIPPFWAPPPQKKKKRRQVLGSLKFRPSGLPPPKKKQRRQVLGSLKFRPSGLPPPKKKTTSGSGIAKIPPFWAPRLLLLLGPDPDIHQLPGPQLAVYGLFPLLRSGRRRGGGAPRSIGGSSTGKRLLYVDLVAISCRCLPFLRRSGAISCRVFGICGSFGAIS